MAQQHDREMLRDAALDLLRWRGYDAVTLDQIAAASDVSPQEFARYFATKDAVLLSLVDDIAQAGVTALARIAPSTNPLDTLLIAYTETLAAIANGVGVMTRERLLVNLGGTRKSSTTTTSAGHSAANSVSAATDATKPPKRSRLYPVPILAPLRRWLHVPCPGVMIRSKRRFTTR